jgi:hypothetical protein
MNSRIQQHVGEEVSRVRKASTQRFRACMAKAPKAEKACTRCLLKEMDPLVPVGVDIRNRFLEQCRGFPQNHNVIYLGNIAAHYGNPLADALLYHSDLQTRGRTCQDIFGIWFQTGKGIELARLWPFDKTRFPEWLGQKLVHAFKLQM